MMPWNKFWVFFDKFFLSFILLGFVFFFLRVKQKWLCERRRRRRRWVCFSILWRFFVDELLDLTWLTKMGLWKKKKRKRIKALSLTTKIPTLEPPLSLPAKMSLASYPQAKTKGNWGEVRAETKKKSGESESESIAKREKKLIKY